MSTIAAWLQGLPRPRSRQDWLEGLAFLLAVACAAAGLGAGVAGYATLAGAVDAAWPAWRTRLAWAVGLVIAALTLLALLGALAPVASPRFLGPVFYYDLIRTARRGRYYITRFLYAAALLGVLCTVYLTYAVGHPDGYTISASEAASFASNFFLLFMVVQLTAVAVVTPAYLAGAIAEEKERKTLEYLLATDLRGREIVFSKLAARVFNLGLLVLTGLPVLSGLQFLGGVDPMLVVAGFVATALTVAGLAGLSLYCSTAARRARDAIVQTYLIAFAYLVASGLAFGLLPATTWSTFPSTVWPGAPVLVGDLVDWFASGNLIVQIVDLAQKVNANVPLSDALMGNLTRYALFNGAVALVGPLVAMRRLRSSALAEVKTPSRRAATSGKRAEGVPTPHRAIGSFPILWKEVVAEAGPRLNVAGRVAVGLLVPASFLPTVLVAVEYLDAELAAIVFLLFLVMAAPVALLLIGWRGGRRGTGLILVLLAVALFLFAALTLLALGGGFGGRGNDALEALNIFQVRVAGTAVACLLLLAVAVRAAGLVSGERDRQTLDGLLTLPLDSDTLLVGKWLGAVLSVRRGWLWLGTLWAVGVVTGALHPVQVPLLALVWFVYAAFAAALGLWFSVTSRTTLRATVSTLATVAFLGGGHLLLWACCAPLVLLAFGGVFDSFEWLAYLQLGVTPPAVFGYCASFPVEDLYHMSNDAHHRWLLLAYATLGAAIWAGAAALLWVATSARFRELTCRAPLARVKVET